ncbi:GNAT family N-acetyltransferase [Actinoplanes sp. NEAU-A12]|uniref:GNAT family N-acetyltransferase n=1 Tax=Actinoplanes sandaracinus TaxID=3045177 RepID=A0ABT6X0P7_9ACTN|nr:GNAT family N-acetyltransferase [Actinoplanes sandaracinus]MDI6105563.1 GNAT family N-acetyltransferase [Actinoplanes sandaracinus]
MRPTLRRLGPSDWRTWRDVRLAALAESPRAFASSLAKESGYVESDWRDWLDPARGLKAVAENGTGLVGAWVPEDRHGAVELYSMWVHPEWRGQGVGDLLIEDVLAWTAENGHTRVDLWLAEGNVAAERLYERHGFCMTEESQPHPGHEGVLEHVMTRQLSG